MSGPAGHGGGHSSGGAAHPGLLGGGRGRPGASHVDANGQAWYAPPESIAVHEGGTGPWINSTEWGQSRQLVLPQTAPPDGEAWTMGGGLQIFARGAVPGPPRRMNVMLQRDEFQSANTRKLRCYARHTLGIGALQLSFTHDWPASGIVVAMPMGSLITQAIVTRSFVGNTYAPDSVAYNFQAGIARASGAVDSTLRYTTQLQPLNNGQTAAIFIPPFARRLMLVPDTSGFFVSTVQGLWSDGVQLFGLVDGSQISPTNSIPFPNGARDLVLQTTTYNGNVSAIWELEV